MATHYSRRHHVIWQLALLLAVSALLSACNLGQQAPSEPATQGALDTLGTVIPQELEQLQLTTTPLVELQVTNTLAADLLVNEQLGPVTVGTGPHRTQEPVTVRVNAGTAVSNVTCSWVHQDTNQTGALGTPTQTPVDANVLTLTYTFTPQLAGTFAVNCTGVATTAAGQRAVSASGTPFTVEAKG